MTGSQIALAAELVLVIAPITLLSIALGGIMVFGVLYSASSGEFTVVSSLLALAIVASWAALAAAWWLGVAFLRWGRPGLVEAPGVVWAGAYTGVVLVCVSVVFLLFEVMVPLWLGAPAVVPLAHLLVERHAGAN